MEAQKTRPQLLYNFSGIYPECGCDEAGRGSLAGPVVAGAVILPENFSCSLLNDSKKLSKKQRETLRTIIEKEALAWSVAAVDSQTIDQMNILNASILAMHIAVSQLKITPSFLIVDGNKFKPYASIPHQTIVKGDARYASIAAASILAKTHRDEMLCRLHRDFPHYHWDKNKAYPTMDHREAITTHGISPYHRKSFRLI